MVAAVAEEEGLAFVVAVCVVFVEGFLVCEGVGKKIGPGSEQGRAYWGLRSETPSVDLRMTSVKWVWHQTSAISAK